jgi:hypothetical protein
MTYTVRIATIVRSSLDLGDERANGALDRLLAAAERRRHRTRYARRSQRAQHDGLIFYGSLVGPLTHSTDPVDIDVTMGDEGFGPVELHVFLHGSKVEREEAVDALKAIAARQDS